MRKSGMQFISNMKRKKRLYDVFAFMLWWKNFKPFTNNNSNTKTISWQSISKWNILAMITINMEQVHGIIILLLFSAIFVYFCVVLMSHLATNDRCYDVPWWERPSSAEKLSIDWLPFLNGPFRNNWLLTTID